jgi:ATP-binding cassette, subfamily B, bacterial
MLHSLNESVTLFPQEPEIFENTIAYNITFWLQEAKVNASEEIFHGLLLAAEQTIPKQQWQKIQNAIIEGELLA